MSTHLTVKLIFNGETDCLGNSRVMSYDVVKLDGADLLATCVKVRSNVEEAC